jgi:DNA-binding response OmpR family regulator
MLDNPNRSFGRLIGLLADPDVDTCDLFSEWLNQRGIDAVQTSNGRAAFNLAVRIQPALVITETWLPTLDGFDLCRLLRGNRATSSIPIIVVTADARQTALDESRRAGANVVLTKPVTIDALDRALVKVRVQQHAHQRNPAEVTNLTCAFCGGKLSPVRDGDVKGPLLVCCEHCGFRSVYGETTKKLRQAG